MKLSKSDNFLLTSWIKLLILMGIMYICSIVVPAAATYEGLGFPCYFNNLVNYSALNLTVRNSAKHLTPTLFLEEPEMFAYITWTLLVDGVAVVYYCLAACAIYRAKRAHATTLVSLQSWIALLGSHSVVYMAILRMWSLQLFVHVLAYKHVLLAAFVYCAHFCNSFAHIQSLISCNSAQWEIRLLEQHVPEKTMLDTLLTYWKPVCVNLYLATLALEMLVFSMGTMMAVGNSFYILVSDTALGAVNLFLVLTLIWYLNTELLLVKFVKRQVGFYIGVFVSYLIMILPLIRYERIFVQAQLHKVIALNISCVPVACVFAVILRIARSEWGWCAPKPQYAPLASKGSETDGHVLQSPVSAWKRHAATYPALYKAEASEVSDTDDSDLEVAYVKYT
ncbi:ORF39 [Retroperitoneal fibromatosis-associated herpesvirus]|uniref:ORF39 n=1 Tax=Retroperitoneal fibromatosis-associated herpesvirus TaxID=111469 RepID=U5NIW5_9GAMA|nr:ORF39 [Retroperitoneal fibromatosis-associated herpesvirus]AGY30721.1 ORF39 [Retroperitoneal fibromatosis-associated herpesvirus]